MKTSNCRRSRPYAAHRVPAPDEFAFAARASGLYPLRWFHAHIGGKLRRARIPDALYLREELGGGRQSTADAVLP